MMNRKNTNSPLYGIRHPLTLLRWTLGFPLQTTDATFSQFHFVSHTECLRFVVFISIMLFEYVFMSILICWETPICSPRMECNEIDRKNNDKVVTGKTVARPIILVSFQIPKMNNIK